jgi:gliding motility-associated-like protein
MPSLIQGRNYLLLVSHFTQTQSGYKLSFGGGTANITDTKIPAFENASSTCDLTKITIRLNKKMRCNTLAADGSDFKLSTNLSTIIAAASGSCNNGFDMETLELTLSDPLPFGDYKVIAQNGTDGNTIADNCETNLAPGSEIAFKVDMLQPTPMDSLVPPSCAPQEFQLVFSKPIRCNSIAADGSDFTITGPAIMQLENARANCDGNGLTTGITVKLRQPIVVGGTYQITLVNGSDLNTLVDECGQVTPAGSAISVSIKDTVSADFTYNTYLGCKTDTVSFIHDGRNGVNSWNWIMDDGKVSSLQSPVAYYNRFGDKQVMLTVSNGFCSDTSIAVVSLNNSIDAKFSFPEIICPEEPAAFLDQSTGIITSWNWNFGNGFSSNSQNPALQPYKLPPLTRELRYNVSLIVGNELGCFDTATVNVKAVSSCYIAVPSAFTPNRDGVNDFLYPLNAFKASNLVFKIFNRYGQVVFETTDWTRKWDGTIKGKPQPAGTYVWSLSYTETDTGKNISMKGSSALIR